MADPQDFFDLLNVHSRGIFTKGTVKDSLLAYWTLGAFGNELVAAPVEEPPGGARAPTCSSSSTSRCRFLHRSGPGPAYADAHEATCAYLRHRDPPGA